MKLIHTADLHLGMRPDKGQPWSGERRDALWAALRRIVKRTESERADLLLIAGDLFHRQPLLRDLKEADSLFASLSRARVVLIAGNHDCLSPRSRYRDFAWAGNVFFLEDAAMSSVFFDDLDTEVHGFSYHQAEISEPLCNGLQAPNDGRIHILLAHGGDARHVPIDRYRLAAAGFHYAALGHIHKPELSEELRLSWCGSPEPLDRTDAGARGYVIAEVSRRQTRLRFVPDCTAQYVSLNVSVTPAAAREGLTASLEQAVKQHGAHSIFSVTLTGERDAGLDLSLPLPLSGRLLSWNDRTCPALDYGRIRQEHKGDLLGLFMDELSQLPASPVRDKALAYGVRACLQEGGGL